MPALHVGSIGVLPERPRYKYPGVITLSTTASCLPTPYQLQKAMLENIYICRHGFRANWEDASVSSGPTGHFNDPPLAPRGLAQADALRTYLASADPRPDALFSSPFYRCLQTITPLAQKTGLPVNVEPGVGEWFAPQPPDTGLHARPKPAPCLQAHIPAQLAEYAPTLYPPRTGESIGDLRGRCELFLEIWIRRMEAEMPEVKTAVIVTHAPLVVGLGRARRDIACPAASVSLYRRAGLSPIGGKADTACDSVDSDCWARPESEGKEAPDVGEWVQVMNGNTTFLPNGAEYGWSYREIVFYEDGNIVDEPADGRPYEEKDLLPVGLGPGMEKYLQVTSIGSM